MNEAVLMIGATEAKLAIPTEGTLEGKAIAAMKAMKDFWMSVDENERFMSAVAGLLQHFGEGSPEYDRITHELKAIRLMNAGLVVGNLDALGAHMEGGPEPIGLMKLWHEHGAALEIFPTTAQSIPKATGK